MAQKQKELGIDVNGLEGPQEEELSMQQYEDFMVWHRGLAVPAARNLDKPDVRRGQELFNKLGCAGCHKPEWTTGEYKPLPGYANQTIRPYTDMLRHDDGGNQPRTFSFLAYAAPLGKGADAQNRQSYRYVP